MLIGIPRLISPKLMAVLMEMGHGDELVIADANFPSHSIARRSASCEPIHCDAADAAALLDAVLTLMPLDYAVAAPVCGMAVPPDAETPAIHGVFADVLAKHGYGAEKMEFLPRFDFYERAAKSYAVVVSGETARFANLILKKGVVG